MNDLDDNRNLYTDNGKPIPELNINPKAYIDKTIVIYGPSKTGKTIITKNIMKIVNNYIDQILVISPSEPSNRSYEGYVDPPFIHYRLYLADPNNNNASSNGKRDDTKERGLAFLESIWKRQEMMAAIYTRTNKIEVLESLFKHVVLHIREEADAIIKNVRHTYKRAIEEIDEKYKENIGIKHAKVKDISSKFEDMLIQVYKKYIHIDYENIWHTELTEDERYSLQYLCFNPRLLLIFDDCAAQLKPYFSKEIFRKLFYQNRHSFITVIVCCQDDTDLPANLRKNAFISFYTEPVVCLSNFERSSNKYSKQSRNFVSEILPHVFKGFRKLAYIREDEKNNFFYHITFEFPTMFKFGSKALHELCNAIQSDKTSMDTSNQYYEYFKI
jgi:tRNA A37 threonylcarbamoyladenosine biosynthesis protein TsaE